MMNTPRIQIVACLFLLILLGQGCPSSASRVSSPTAPGASPAQKPMEKEMEKPSNKMDSPDTRSQTSTYEPFTKTKYDEARNAGKPIFLFFYANWCPTCREQEPRLQRIIPTHKGEVVGLRVNYNDTEVDADEKALAKEFGVTYQHTGFFIGRDGATKKKTIGTITDAQTLEYLDSISN